MTRAMYIAAVFAFATVLTQANQCANGGTGCTGDNVPQNIVSMLQTNLKTNVLKDGGEEAAALEDDQGTGILASKERSQLGSLSAKGNSNAILTELEEHVRSGTTPPFEVISQIKSLIMDDIMPDLQTARDTVAQDTTKVMSEIATCNNDFISSEAYPGSTLQESVNSTRQDHKTCRHAQKAMFNANLTGDDSDCVKLGNLLRHTFPSTSPDPGNRAAAVQYVNNTLPIWGTILELNAKCATQEKQLVDKDAECSTDQKTFESDFCYWKSELESDCKVLDSCYSRSLSLYTDHVAKMKVLYQKWDIESATLQKILCFCNVWLEARDEDDNRSDHNATHFAVCSKITHTPTPLEIESPEKVDCLLSSVAKHPGTQAFVTKEYINFTSFVAEVASCPQAPTLVPTTVAPTSSTQAPTTEATTTEAPTTEATTAAPSTATPTTTEASSSCQRLMTTDGSEILDTAYWNSQCAQIPPDASFVKVSMGAVTDYYKPTGSNTMCQMLTSNHKHTWSTDGFTWTEPAWTEEPPLLGGCKKSWPKDGRYYLSFWGSNRYYLSAKGGCCSSEYSRPTSWNQAFTMHYCTEAP